MVHLLLHTVVFSLAKVSVVYTYIFLPHCRVCSETRAWNILQKMAVNFQNG